jgi:soluble lytic murein transglycosylase-like protein
MFRVIGSHHNEHQISGGIMPTMKVSSLKAAQMFIFYGAVFTATFIPAHATLEALREPTSDAFTIALHLEKLPTLTWSEEVDQYADRLIDAYDIAPNKAKQFAGWILEASDSKQSADLIAGVIMTESSFRTNVTSKAGAVGPTQVKPKYWSDSCGDLNNPLDNIKCGAMVIKKYTDMANGNLKTALMMYNVGPTNYKQSKLVDASNRYVTKVARHLAMLENSSVVIR